MAKGNDEKGKHQHPPEAELSQIKRDIAALHQEVKQLKAALAVRPNAADGDAKSAGEVRQDRGWFQKGLNVVKVPYTLFRGAVGQTLSLGASLLALLVAGLLIAYVIGQIYSPGLIVDPFEVAASGLNGEAIARQLADELRQLSQTATTLNLTEEITCERHAGQVKCALSPPLSLPVQPKSELRQFDDLTVKAGDAGLSVGTLISLIKGVFGVSTQKLSGSVTTLAEGEYEINVKYSYGGLVLLLPPVKTTELGQGMQQAATSTLGVVGQRQVQASTYFYHLRWGDYFLANQQYEDAVRSYANAVNIVCQSNAKANPGFEGACANSDPLSIYEKGGQSKLLCTTTPNANAGHRCAHEAFHSLALVHDARQDNDTAQTYFQIALDLLSTLEAPRFREIEVAIRNNQALTYQQLGHHEKAHDVYQAAADLRLSLNPKVDDEILYAVYLNQALNHLEAAQANQHAPSYLRAVNTYAKAIDLLPHKPLAYYNFAYTLETCQALPECQHMLDAAADEEIRPQTDPEHAYLMAIDKDDRFTYAYINLGWLYTNRLLSPPPPCSPPVTDGMSRERNKWLAVHMFQKAIQSDPQNALAHNNLGLIYLEADRDWERAAVAFEQAVQRDPKFAMAHTNLGLAYHRMGQKDKAIEAYQQALQADPHYAPAYRGLWSAYYSRDKAFAVLHMKEALAIFEQQSATAQIVDLLSDARNFLPQQAWVHFKLGKALLGQRKFESAKAAYQDGIQAATGEDLRAAAAELGALEDGEAKDEVLTGLARAQTCLEAIFRRPCLKAAIDVDDHASECDPNIAPEV